MNKPITPETMKQWKEANSIAGKLEGQIQERITYIIGTWFKAFGGKLDYWYFDGAGEGEVGSLADHMNAETISCIITGGKLKDNDTYGTVIIDKDGDEYGWQSEIPTRWLFEEGFEQEIVEGKKLFDEQQAKKKQQAQDKRNKKKEQDTELVKKAKAKLSKEELAAIKRDL